MRRSIYKRIRFLKSFIKFKRPGLRHNLEKKSKKKKNNIKNKCIFRKRFKYEN